MKIRDKKAMSAIIGYVLLISFAIIIGGLTYSWMKTYVPRGDLKCPDDVSIFVDEGNCTNNGGNYTLEIEIKNNGMFNVGGYNIYVSNKTGEGNIYGIGSYLKEYALQKEGSLVVLENPHGPGDSKILTFREIPWKVKAIEITPIRFEERGEGKKEITNCGNARIIEEINC